ncbi:PREDICTED: ras-related protein RABF2b [Papilio xuthus]|uniref:Ras-related protein RABF2b n=1 Tax=Papilio xuthus TaxID=66420 RepID=A0AAJ6ZMK3_PAPXU|nr:PREDICTED: ras-related protein RABF2b [Papilio xuthus]
MKVIEAKIVVLGSQGVGKTSLVVRYIGKMFSRHISPTIGASFFTCNINLAEARVKLQVWDTAGQERFRSMAPMYYRNANAALLVFDITCRASFAAVKGWVKELQSNAAGPLVLALVGNKADLAAARAVPATDAARYAAALGAPYTETSALHDQWVREGRRLWWVREVW